MKNHVSDFYFSSFREKIIKSWGGDVKKMTITRKIKIEKVRLNDTHCAYSYKFPGYAHEREVLLKKTDHSKAKN